jgi:hypothetical protein
MTLAEIPEEIPSPFPHFLQIALFLMTFFFRFCECRHDAEGKLSISEGIAKYHKMVFHSCVVKLHGCNQRFI